MQISLHADMVLTKRSIIWQRTPTKPVVIKSLLETNCKRFRQSAAWENLNLKPETQLERNDSNNGSNYTLPANEVKEKLQPVSCIYLWTIFDHQLNDMSASQKFKVFSSPRRPKTQFRHTQGHQSAYTLTGSINIFQSTLIAVYELEHQKTINPKLGKQTISNQRNLPILPRKHKEWKTQTDR